MRYTRGMRALSFPPYMLMQYVARALVCSIVVLFAYTTLHLSHMAPSQSMHGACPAAESAHILTSATLSVSKNVTDVCAVLSATNVATISFLYLTALVLLARAVANHLRRLRCTPRESNTVSQYRRGILQPKLPPSLAFCLA